MYSFPPATLIKDLKCKPQNSNLWVAGLVVVRQRPYTANGTLFITLEDGGSDFFHISTPFKFTLKNKG